MAAGAWARLLALVLATSLVAAGCGAPPPVRTAPDLLAGSGAGDPRPTGSTVSGAGTVPVWRVQVVQRRGHDPAAFTQGLQLSAGQLFESRGRYGRSALTEVDPLTGEVLRRLDLPAEDFAEGMTVVGDRIVLLTWREERAYVVDSATFEIVDVLGYKGEGWGLCYDGEHLVMSDGSDVLTWRDPRTFEVVRTVRVSLDGRPVGRLNELECVGDAIYTNVWREDALVIIDAATGDVTAVIDARGLLSEVEAAGADVLNGVAFDRDSRAFLLTGKLWPAMFVVEFVPRP